MESKTMTMIRDTRKKIEEENKQLSVSEFRKKMSEEAKQIKENRRLFNKHKHEQRS